MFFKASITFLRYKFYSLNLFYHESKTTWTVKEKDFVWSPACSVHHRDLSRTTSCYLMICWSDGKPSRFLNCGKALAQSLEVWAPVELVNVGGGDDDDAGADFPLVSSCSCFHREFPLDCISKYSWDAGQRWMVGIAAASLIPTGRLVSFYFPWERCSTGVASLEKCCFGWRTLWELLEVRFRTARRVSTRPISWSHRVLPSTRLFWYAGVACR